MGPDELLCRWRHCMAGLHQHEQQQRREMGSTLQAHVPMPCSCGVWLVLRAVLRASRHSQPGMGSACI